MVELGLLENGMTSINGNFTCTNVYGNLLFSSVAVTIRSYLISDDMCHFIDQHIQLCRWNLSIPTNSTVGLVCSSYRSSARKDPSRCHLRSPLHPLSPTLPINARQSKTIPCPHTIVFKHDPQSNSDRRHRIIPKSTHFCDRKPHKHSIEP